MQVSETPLCCCCNNTPPNNGEHRDSGQGRLGTAQGTQRVAQTYSYAQGCREILGDMCCCFVSIYKCLTQRSVVVYCRAHCSERCCGNIEVKEEDVELSELIRKQPETFVGPAHKILWELSQENFKTIHSVNIVEVCHILTGVLNDPHASDLDKQMATAALEYSGHCFDPQNNLREGLTLVEIANEPSKYYGCGDWVKLAGISCMASEGLCVLKGVENQPTSMV